MLCGIIHFILLFWVITFNCVYGINVDGYGKSWTRTIVDRETKKYIYIDLTSYTDELSAYEILNCN